MLKYCIILSKMLCINHLNSEVCFCFFFGGSIISYKEELYEGLIV